MGDGTRGLRSRTSRRRLARVVLALLAASAAVPARRAAAEWVVDAEGRCVQQWTPASLVRGPTALLMSPTAIPRAVAGAITSMDTLRKDAPSGSSWTAGPALVFLWGANGFVEMLIWMGTGLADTVTGGALSIAPDDAVELSFAPLTYGPVAPPLTDRCGRPVG
jgi:hypothetical protein